jgi:FkbM family methyltransferase
LALTRTLSFIAQHPLNRARPVSALWRFVRWQTLSRLHPGTISVPFVDGTTLQVRRGMTGATGNVYCGLHEYEHMAFLLHFLRAEDLFVDIGANVGSYTVLAAGVVGARCIAIEPIGSAHATLVLNLVSNRIEERVDALNIGLSDSRGVLAFTTGSDTTNHVVPPGAIEPSASDIQVDTLDHALGGKVPTLIKLDVEGYEAKVIAGASATLSDARCVALIVELNGSGAVYGKRDADIDRTIRSFGFTRVRYEPEQRRLGPDPNDGTCPGNALFVRDLRAASARVAAAPRRHVRPTHSWV